MTINPNVPEVNSRLERALIDASCRVPVLLFFGTAIFWLLAGSILALLASFKLHTPEFFTWDLGFLTFGRVRPAHLNAVIYGWASAAGIGVGIWLMARLSRVPLRNQFLVIGACILWNIGVTVGVVSILAGKGTSIEWLEFPKYATYILFVAYAGIGVWGIDMFVRRKPGHVYVSQWYIFAAFFWFPWLYATANIMLILMPVQGSTQAIINWWYAHNALGLWFTPFGLAAAYYMIPKVTGKPVHSYYLSIVGFWSLALFYSWNGGHHLIGGPIPVWITTAASVASFMMVIPVVTTAINHHMTMIGSFHLLKTSPTLRFVVFGAMSYTLASLQGSMMAIPSWNNFFHFTHYTIGHSHLGLYAFFTMIMFGSIYYIVPRLVGWEWPSARLIKIHFWCTAIGIVLMVVTLSLGGMLQGLGLSDKNVTFASIIVLVRPWLELRSVSGILLTIGHLAFAISFVLMLFRFGGEKSQPTLFTNSPATKVT
jgi:cytochrome c oxidase cbb3-type subunit 1